MDDYNPDDRGPLPEILLFVPGSFLMAWFLAGFSLWDLCEIASRIAFRGWFVLGTIAGGVFAWVVVRIANWRDTPRPPGSRSDWP
jgi:hypothetical protein